MTAAVLLVWLKLLALDGDLARTEPKTRWATGSCTPRLGTSAVAADDG
jgi:hypothetical protein